MENITHYTMQSELNINKKNSRSFRLFNYQYEALKKMHNGCILCGGVGTGKSFVSLNYYFIRNGGNIQTFVSGVTSKMVNPKNLYIITTAAKRDTLEWEKELIQFSMSTDKEINIYNNKIVIDSWNNIKKYVDVKNSFFIFDEQRVVGYGVWSRSFIKITKNNEWILLSATPGDTWSDYISVFVANGYYKNKYEFLREHAVYNRFTKYPEIKSYINTGRLLRQRNEVLVTMDFKRETIPIVEEIYCNYDIHKYKSIIRNRWNPWTNEPIESPSEVCIALRRVTSESPSKQIELLDIVQDHKKVIVFYNYNYELDILRALYYGEDFVVAEWNGHKHEKLPKGDKWVYLVQYTAGCEGWNCITTDTMVFYSQNYSYKVMEQARGRIDRVNTPYTELYYYHLITRSGIDIAIGKALSEKRQFNESIWCEKTINKYQRKNEKDKNKIEQLKLEF